MIEECEELLSENQQKFELTLITLLRLECPINMLLKGVAI